MRKQDVELIISDLLSSTDIHLITLNVTTDNLIQVELDSYKGVDLDTCAQISRKIQERLDRDIEDYELEVGSVSLTDPFKAKMQYEKHLGHDVEVLDKMGKKHIGQLVEVNDSDFSIDAEQMVLVEGKKRKQRQIVTISFSYDDVKSTRYLLKV